MLLGFFLGSRQLINTLQSLPVTDGKITQEGIRQLTAALFFLCTLGFAAGVICLCTRNATGWDKLRRAFWSEALANHLSFASPRWIFGISTALGLFLIVNINLYPPASTLFARLYFEDGVFETLTVVMMFSASICLAATLWFLWKVRRRNPLPLFLAAFLALAALALFVYAGEEISWGQRILGWSRPDWFPAGNLQNETNLHNYFNTNFLLLYQALIIFPLPVLWAWRLNYTQRSSPARALILPHPSLLGITLLIAFVAAVRPQEQELIEEMSAVFALAYSVRILGISWASGKTNSFTGKSAVDGRVL